MAEIYGRVDSRIQSDSYFSSSEFAEEYVDLRVVDEENGVESVVSFSLRHEDKNEFNIHQLYYLKKLDGPFSSYKLGRFERADSLGFYTLDGAFLRAKHNDIVTNLYLGKPSRIDGYETVTGDALYGVDVHFSNIKIPKLSNNVKSKPSVARIGLQRLENKTADDPLSEVRFNWGFSTAGEIINNRFSSFGFESNGSYLTDERQSEHLNFKLFGNFDKNKRLQLGYETFINDEQELSFRDQFYSVYVKGRQTALSGSYFYKPDRQTSWEVKARSVLREYGRTGFGVTLGQELNKYSGTEYTTQLDILTLGSDRIYSLYGETNYSFSPMVISKFGAAIQHKHTWLTGDNFAVALDSHIQKMVQSGLYLSATFSHVWNSNVKDEYLFSLKLSYHFDERIKEKFHD